MVRTALTDGFRLDRPVEWTRSDGFVDYQWATSIMEGRVAAIRDGAPELVWLLEHPPLYTAGASAKDDDLLEARFPVYRSARGGQFTYHGPGQRVAYVMLNVGDRRRDVRGFIAALERWLIDALAECGVQGETRRDRVGVWVDRGQSGDERREDKIAAIGVRLRHWVSFHGVALNVAPDLSHFAGIVPCGVAAPGLGVTSLADLGVAATLKEADAALRRSFHRVFGPTADAPAPSDETVILKAPAAATS